jgi:hypothetical protein
MAKLESFADLTKLQEDLLKKNFCLAQPLALSLYARSGTLSVKSSMKQTSSSSHGLAYIQLLTNRFKAKQEFASCGSVKSLVEYTPETRPELKLKAELESSRSTELQKASFTVEKTLENHRHKLVFADNMTVRFSGVHRLGAFGVGGDFLFDLGPMRLTTYNAALWLCRDNLRAVLKHESTNTREFVPGNLVGSVFVSQFRGLALGGTVKLALAQQEVTASAGLETKVGENNVVKARIDSERNLGIAIRSKVNEKVTVVVASQAGVGERKAPLKFGLRVKINQ